MQRPLGPAWPELRLRRFAAGAERAACRAWMTRQLAAWLRVDAAGLRLARGPGGKPHLPDHPDLQFNLSHSGGWAALAIGRGAPVGVDLETRLLPPERALALARRYFSAAEQAWLAAAPDSQRAWRFRCLWSRREAWGKALGEGLSAAMARPAPPAHCLASWQNASFSLSVCRLDIAG
ncbi:hypothetical protein CEK28_18420 [Xenophilus sp. AP218F]|nr:hypothetical protein CEK28_18420 [Xenophilus sp. AP218F]